MVDPGYTSRDRTIVGALMFGAIVIGFLLGVGLEGWTL